RDDDVPDAPPFASPGSVLEKNGPTRAEPETPHEKILEPEPPQLATPPPESSEEDGYQATDEEQDLVRLTMQVAQFVRETETELAAYLEQTVPLRKSGNTLFLGLEKGHLFEQQIKS